MSYAYIRLEDDQLQRLADLVAERLEHTASAQDHLVDAKKLARRLGVTRSFVYEHARDLGAIRLGAGPRARVRFDPAVAIRAMQSRFSPEQAAASTMPPPRRRTRKQARHPFLEPNAVWDGEAGLWKDRKGYPTSDQIWRSTGTGTHGLVAEGPHDEAGATHHEWEVARREWRKQHPKGARPTARRQ